MAVRVGSPLQAEHTRVDDGPSSLQSHRTQPAVLCFRFGFFGGCSSSKAGESHSVPTNDHALYNPAPSPSSLRVPPHLWWATAGPGTRPVGRSRQNLKLVACFVNANRRRKQNINHDIAHGLKSAQLLKREVHTATETTKKYDKQRRAVPQVSTLGCCRTTRTSPYRVVHRLTRPQTPLSCLKPKLLVPPKARDYKCLSVTLLIWDQRPRQDSTGQQPRRPLARCY